MTVLITGAGLVGSQIARILVEDGYEPVLYDINPPMSFVEKVVPVERLKIKRGDIRDIASLIDVIKQEKVDVIVHTAAILPPASEENARLAVDVNVQGTANVLEAARLMGVPRVVFCSTIGVYDMSAVRGDKVREDDPLLPGLVYTGTKVIAEKLGENYARRKGVEFVALRFAHVFGPGPLPPTTSVGTLVDQLVNACMYGGRSVVQPRSPGARECVYVMDAARSAVLAVKARNIKDNIFNIGMGRAYELSEMAQVACGVTPEVDIDMKDADLSSGMAFLTVPDRPYDLTRAREQLGYTPAYDLGAAIRHYMDWMRRS